MKRTKPTRQSKAGPAGTDPCRLRPADEAGRERQSQVHVYGRGVVCGTDKRGHATPGGLSPLQIVVDA